MAERPLNSPDRRRGRPRIQRPTRASAAGLSHEAAEAANVAGTASALRAHLLAAGDITGLGATGSLSLSTPPALPTPARPAAGAAPATMTPAAQVARMRGTPRRAGAGPGARRPAGAGRGR